MMMMMMTQMFETTITREEQGVYILCIFQLTRNFNS
jgi:hypothetical protein